jgi:hypothetical protein
MFNAGNNSGYGLNDGLGGVYADGERSDRHALGTQDALRCGIFVGPALTLAGVLFMVRGAREW